MHRLSFIPWSSSFILSSKGMHILNLPESFPLSMGCFRFTFDHQLTPNYHEYLEISYIAAGTGIFRVGNREYKIEKGDLIVLGNTELHTVYAQLHEPLDIISIYFMPELIYRPGSNPLDFEYIRFLYNYDYNHSNHIPNGKVDISKIENLVTQMYFQMNNKPKHYQLIAKNCLNQILVQLLMFYESNMVSNNSHYDHRQSDIQRLNPVLFLIEEKYNKQITLNQAAEAANLSKEYFCRFFKRVTGDTFTQYLNKFRIDKAKQLLVTKNLPIIHIAYEVGFDNLSYFYRVFQNLVKITPTEYVRRIEKGKLQ